MKTGKLPINAMKRSVFGQIRTKREEVLNGAGAGEDCAIFSSGPEGAVAVCVQEAALDLGQPADIRQTEMGPTGPGRGQLDVSWGQQGCRPWNGEAPMTMADLIVKCANNLAAGGAEPVAVLVALLLPQGMEEPQVKALMAQAEEKCAELHIQIAGGQTRMTAAANAPMAVVTGYGRAAEGYGRTAKRAAAPGQDIVLSKWIGLQGTARLAESCREKLLERYPAWLVEEALGFGRYLSVLPEAEIARKHGVCAMHDASEGGILGALWELAEGAGTGLMADMRMLPLRQETVEVCECCGANPYELLSGGCLIMTAWDGQELAAALNQAHIPAAVIGRLTEGNDRILRNGDEIRYLDRPRRDSIYDTI